MIKREQREVKRSYPVEMGYGMKEEYIGKTIEIMRQLDDVEMLKKVYTMAKTLLSIWQEEQEKKGGAI